jgi:hypothetical protein
VDERVGIHDVREANQNGDPEIRKCGLSCHLTKLSPPFYARAPILAKLSES